MNFFLFMGKIFVIPATKVLVKVYQIPTKRVGLTNWVVRVAASIPPDQHYYGHAEGFRIGSLILCM